MTASSDGSVPDPAVAPASGDELSRLRELLLGADLRELAEARRRIAELEAAQRDLPSRLPTAAAQALRTEHARERAAELLAEPVTRALGNTVRTNRQYLVDALFPVIGPVVRRAIAEALRTMVANLNVALESSFTLRGLKWRVEAWRSGVPYAQVVLRHRFMCSIDHVFLIERDSGLLLHHVSAPGVSDLDPDAIAGMLTALSDFVGDSVGEREGSALASAEVGDHVVWIEHGTRANLACFIRGVPPASLRTLMEQRVERVHERFLEWPDDATLPDICRQGKAELDDLLAPASFLQEIGRDEEADARRGPRGPALLVLGALALAGLALLVAKLVWDHRVDALRARLEHRPGFVLTGMTGKAWRSLEIGGLVDADAEPLADVLAAAGLGPVDPVLLTRGYIATDDAIIERRATRLLQPPHGVRLSVQSGVLHLAGRAPAEWVEHARERATWIPGTAGVRFAVEADGPTRAERLAEARSTAASINEFCFEFAPSSEVPSREYAGELDRMAGEIRRVLDLARATGLAPRVAAVGYADSSGDAVGNAWLRARRAHWLADRIVERGVADVAVVTSANAQRAARCARIAIVLQGEESP